MKEPDWSNPKLTIGDLYHPAMKITNPEEASAYFEKIVTYAMAHTERGDKRTREEHEATQKSNLGYFAGYYDGKTMERVNRLFNCVHPIFGGTAPSTEEAFKAGKDFAAKKIKMKEQPKGAPKRTNKKVRSIILAD